MFSVDTAHVPAQANSIHVFRLQVFMNLTYSLYFLVRVHGTKFGWGMNLKSTLQDMCMEKSLLALLFSSCLCICNSIY